MPLPVHAAVSLLLLALSLLHVPTFKGPGETVVPVDQWFLAFYTALVGLIAVVFLLKVRVDERRAKLVALRNALLPAELNLMTQLGRGRYLLHFQAWIEVSAEIERAYIAYNGLRERAGGPKASIMPSELKLFEVESVRKIPELVDETLACTARKKALLDELAKDRARFVEEAERILQAWKEEPEDAYAELRPLDKRPHVIDAVYARTLSSWVEANATLCGCIVKSQWVEQVEKITTTLDQVRKIDAALERYGPVAFAGLTLVFVWLARQLWP